MRKIIMMLLVLAMTVCGAVGIAACGKEPEPEQNQGQVEQNKDKEKEEPKPNQNQGENNKDDEEKEDEKGETGSENPTKPGEKDPPVTPEPQKPNPEEPKDEEQKEEDKEEDKKDEEEKNDGKEEEPPQGNEPEVSDPDPEKPTPSDPEKKEPEKDKNPEEKTEPEEPKDECEHSWTYTVIGDDLNNRMHYGECTKCHKKIGPTNCTLGTISKHVDPTCTEDGYDSYTCSVCKQVLVYYGFDIKTMNVKYPKTGHNFDGQSWTHIEGTSHTVTATASQHERHCGNKNCTYVEIAECEFTGEIKAPTCEKAGEDTRECKECHYHLQSENLNKLEHSWEYTSNKDGHSHTKRCARACCANKEFGTEECDFGEGSKQEGNCGQKGSITYHCSKCNQVKTVETPGHKYTESNFCDVCHQDGLQCVNGKLSQNGGYSLNKIIYTQELQNVSKIFIGNNIGGKAVHGIDLGAFKDFKNLTEIYIPKSILAIGTNAFEGTGLKTIYYEGSETEWNTKIVADGVMSWNFAQKFKETQLGKTVQVATDKNADEIKKEWNIGTESNAATIAALPAGDNKRLYA